MFLSLFLFSFFLCFFFLCFVLFVPKLTTTEVKTLKSLVRNVIDPQRDLGHTDRALRGEGSSTATAATAAGDTTAGAAGSAAGSAEKKEECADCR